jgi:flagellar motor protein MotB
VEELQKKNMELEKTVEKIRTEKESAGTDFQKKIESFENLLAQNDRELKILRGENQQLKTDEVALRENVLSLENQVAQKETEAQTTHEENQQLRTVETDLREKIQSLDDLLAQKATEVQTSREEIQQLRSHKSDLQGKTQSLENQLVQKEREEQISRDENQDLQKKIVKLEDNLVAVIQKSAYLNQKLQGSKNQIERLNQEMAARDEKLEKIAEEHQALVSQFDNLAEEREYLNRKTQELNRKLGLSSVQLDTIAQEAISKEKKLLALNTSYEELKTRLNKQIQEKELQISTLENKLNIRLLNKILFDPGQTVISPNGKRVLESLAEELKKVEGIQISVEGHTDNQPLGQKIRTIYIDNLGLSVARSAAVARKLRGMGVNPKILSAAGYSMHRPVAGNAAPEGQQQNRRVEIILAPLQ